jgi:hypothetical protein
MGGVAKMGNNDDRMSLFEGIIIGIYGNWLISLRKGWKQ